MHVVHLQEFGYIHSSQSTQGDLIFWKISNLPKTSTQRISKNHDFRWVEWNDLQLKLQKQQPNEALKHDIQIRNQVKELALIDFKWHSKTRIQESASLSLQLATHFDCTFHSSHSVVVVEPGLLMKWGSSMGVLANDGIRYPKNTYNSSGYEANQPFLAILGERCPAHAFAYASKKLWKFQGGPTELSLLLWRAALMKE